MADVESGFLQRAQAVGDAAVEMLGGFLDRAFSFLKQKGGELLGGIGSSVSGGFRSMKESVGNAITPNSIGQSKSSPTPSIAAERAPSISPEVSGPSKDFSGILQSSGFSTESLGSAGIESTDLGNVSVGHDNVGCVAQGGVRAAQTQTQVLNR